MLFQVLWSSRFGEHTLVCSTRSRERGRRGSLFGAICRLAHYGCAVQREGGAQREPIAGLGEVDGEGEVEVEEEMDEESK